MNFVIMTNEGRVNVVMTVPNDGRQQVPRLELRATAAFIWTEGTEGTMISTHGTAVELVDSM